MSRWGDSLASDVVGQDVPPNYTHCWPRSWDPVLVYLHDGLEYSSLQANGMAQLYLRGDQMLATVHCYLDPSVKHHF